MIHYCPDPSIRNGVRVSRCGLECYVGGGPDGTKPRGNSQLEKSDCPACEAAEKQPSLFGGQAVGK